MANNIPGVWQGAENDQVISRSARVGAGLVIIRVAIRAWASVLKVKRVHRRTTRVGRGVSLTAAIPWIPKRLTRAPTRDTPATAISSIPTGHPKVRGTRAVEVHQTPGGAAPSSGATLRNDQHREVITVDQADVIEVQTVGTVEREFRQCRRWLCAGAAALNLAGAAVGGGAGEFPVGVLTAECPGPNPTRPGPRDVDCPRFSGVDGEAGSGKRRRGGAGEESRPYGVAALVYNLERC